MSALPTKTASTDSKAQAAQCMRGDQRTFDGPRLLGEFSGVHAEDREMERQPLDDRRGRSSTDAAEVPGLPGRPYREGRKRAAAAHESAAVTSVESMRTRRGPAWQARPGIQHARPNREATPRPMTS